MNKSETISELAKALCKAQSEMMGAVKDAKNPFFKSNYADLSAVVKAVKEPFSNNGLSYSQFPITNDSGAGVSTILMHESGEFLQSELVLPLSKRDAQGAGSAITYARRYALQSLAGIPSEDDDGNLASSNAQSTGFVVDDSARQWINAVKQDKAVLDQITDPAYKQFIKTNAGI